MNQDSQFVWAAALTVLGLWVLVPGINRPLLWLLDKHLVQGMIWMVEKVVVWTFWLVKWMWTSQWVLIKHLFTPRSAFLPTTDDQHHKP
ncbi:hypothetical protein EV700_0174 [Fluviicoccus keumensis]|uniref:Uncharacterized protein n=1 Tax=Fluviicoccus keumensis TaxID=1435465 RepID=A0A4Q7ZDG1_9GAMM|nr:hypothetical protein [Fluviicoccus keumensis]RZU48113.1 hypothetical protein EV700_0174 [Fluviicoccus keumensis]